MSEGSGTTLDVISVPSSDAGSKFPLLFAARDELPDLLAFDMVGGHTKYAGEGLVAFDGVDDELRLTPRKARGKGCLKIYPRNGSLL